MLQFNVPDSKNQVLNFIVKSRKQEVFSSALNKAGSWETVARVVMVSKHFIGFSKRISNILENNIFIVNEHKIHLFQKKVCFSLQISIALILHGR